MATSNLSILDLDPNHISCIGGRTVVTCRHCAGNAPRGAICTSCDGRGFNIFICMHCNPAAAAAAVRSSSIAAASATTNTTPGSSAPSSPGSLSRSPSTSYPSHPDPRASRSLRRPDGSRDGTNCGRVETNTPRNL
ncbi:hypothetical protein N7462_002383 [Penicillium macrosclerotiorum]|uniref:uncharacterized protein n=1 Tax=Penicillium macrosclerotiorum TaxID=303699 RepID=UPI002546F0B6|nr:uncharacterized protein N7462_002383 [Penicillium macrosclerotiorum]KAJ5692960.1 hypothetical protein N7462_002383 [Penicillium macrosclerotiorum]